MRSAQQRADLLSRAQLNTAGGVISILVGLVAGANTLILNGRVTFSFVLSEAIFFGVSAILFTTARNFFRAARNALPIWLTPKRGDDWGRGIIRKGSGLQLFGAVAISVTVLVAFAVAGGRYALVGCAIACAAVVRSVYLLIVWLRSGPAMLVASHLPARLGQEFSGTIRTSIPTISTIPETGALVKLSSFSCWGVGDDGGEKCLWQERHEVKPQLLQLSASKLQIPFQFSIPSGARPTDRTYPNQSVEWRLEASATLPGVDFDVTFLVPVVDEEMAKKIALGTRRLS